MKIFILIVLLFGTISCTNIPEKIESNEDEISTNEISEEYDLGEPECVYKLDTLSKLHYYPFNVADQIKIVSFKDKFISDPPENVSSAYYYDSIIVDGKIAVPNLLETITLDKIQTDSLYSILFNYSTKRKGNIVNQMDCYNPRHAIVFFKENKAIAFFEICFECQNFKRSKNFENYIDFCSDKWCMLQNHFRWVGIKSGLLKEICSPINESVE